MASIVKRNIEGYSVEKVYVVGGASALMTLKMCLKKNWGLIL
jgi:Ethanolamine utilization protein EutJ (predicted chaperonin)